MPNLAQIRTKIRKVTQTPSINDVSDADLDGYINNFILYDFPSELRLFSLRRNLTFYTTPNVDTYESNAIAGDPLEDFKNKYVAVHEPVYCGGVRLMYTQYREVFFGDYPNNNVTSDTQLRGDGLPGQVMQGIIAAPVLQGSVTFSALDINQQSLIIIDSPINRTSGNLTTADGVISGVIDYITGAYIFQFSNNVLLGDVINVNYVAYSSGKPASMLYFNDTFTLRPIPDRVYPVVVEVDVRPTELLNAEDVPDLAQWWEFIAYGAARKLLDDLGDPDTKAIIMPEYQRQEDMVNRRNLIQRGNQRTTTVFTVGKNRLYGPNTGPNWPY